MFTALEAKIRAFTDRVDGDALHAAVQARDAALAELDAVRENTAKTGPLLADFEAAVRTAVAAAEPGMKSEVEGLLVKFAGDLGGVLAAKM